MTGPSKSERTRAFRRYLALQVPGWILVILACVALNRVAGLPAWGGALVLALWVLKDLLLYPWLRFAYIEDRGGPASRIVGAIGVAEQDLDPVGIVRVGHELWIAQIPEGAPHLSCGVSVAVTRMQGLMLIVEPLAPESRGELDAR